MRVLALDIGEKRLGVAISDPARRVATPLVVLDTRSELGGARELRRIIDDYEVGELVVGLPLTMAGEEGPQAARVRILADRLAQFLPIPAVFADERLSSSEAVRRMAEVGADSRARRGSVDKVAAAIFLQGYLDAAASNDDDEGQ